MFTPDNNPIKALEISNNFSRFSDVEWFLKPVPETVFPIKHTEDLKSTGSNYYLGQTLTSQRLVREMFASKKPSLATLASASELRRFLYLAASLYIVIIFCSDWEN